MTTGIGYHALAFIFTILTLLILLMVSKIEKIIGGLQRQKMLTITFRHDDFSRIIAFEQRLATNELRIERLEVTKNEDRLTVIWQVSAKKEFLVGLTYFLANEAEIVCFA